MSSGLPVVNRSAFQAVAAEVSAPQDKNCPIVLLGEMAQALGQHYDVPLPIPELIQPGQEDSYIKKAKEFSVGLLENPGTHSWCSEGYRRLSASDRLTIAGSLFLWRKTLPSKPASQLAHRMRVTAPEIALPSGYVPHLVRIVEENFPVGWDHKYMEAVERMVPTTKSVIGQGRGKGGYRNLKPDRFEYGRACIGETRMDDSGFKVKYMDAACDGKTRAVTIMEQSAQRLKPLHKILYDQISNSPWLLRGEAKPSVFSSFKRVPGEVFVSGDYESATDHLPVTSAEWILRAIFRRARYVPDEIQADAIKFLRVTIEYDEGCFKATRQLMGSLLCFPLLCLQNYCAFRWVFSKETPVKINGDDIVFRARREDYEAWASFVGSVGLVLSPGKTMVSQSHFSLNSTFFRSSKDRVRLVPVVRCTSLLPSKSPYPGSLSGTFRGFLKGFSGSFRDALGAWFLRRKGALIRKSGRSVVRGLKIAASDVQLKQSGLWTRELWYVNSVPSRFLAIGYEDEGEPLPLAPDRLTGQLEIPTGWALRELPRDKRKARLAREEEREFWEELVDKSWETGFNPKTLEKEFWTAVSRGGFEVHWQRSKKRVSVPKDKLFRMLLGSKTRSRMPSKALYRVIRQRKSKVEKVWTRVDEVVEEPGPEITVKRGIDFPEWFFPHSSLTRHLPGRSDPQALSFRRWCEAEDAMARYVQ